MSNLSALGRNLFNASISLNSTINHESITFTAHELNPVHDLLQKCVNSITVINHNLAVLIALVQNTLQNCVKVCGVLGVWVGGVLDYVDYLGECFLIEHGVL